MSAILNREAKIPVLFLVMEFAPVNTTGNFRTLKFIKHLGKQGIQSIVVTFVEEEAAKYFNAKLDESLLSDLPGDCIIYRIHCDDKTRFQHSRLGEFLMIYFSIKDSLAKRWRPHLMPEIGDIMQRHQPQVIFTSLPPYSAGLLSVELSKKFKIPLVVDMRDLWALFGVGPLGSRIHYWLTLQEERKIFKHASAVLAVTPQMIKTILRVHSGLDTRKFHYISNGFDGELSAEGKFVFPGGKRKITIGYVGSFYFDPSKREASFKPWWQKRWHKIFEYTPVKHDWLYRSPYFFLKTVAYLIEKHPALKDRLQIEFVGTKPVWIDNMLTEFNLHGNFISHGFVSAQRSIELQQNFDLLLATSEKIPGAEHYCLPSKVFDYVIQRKPILAFVTEGIQKEFMIKSGLGVICDPDNVQESALTLFDLITNGRSFSPNGEYLETFKRSNLAKKLSDVFRTLVVE